MPRSFRSRKVTSGPSAIHGSGMFASEPIAAGEIVWVRTGDIVDEAEARARDALYGDYSLQIEDQLFLSLAAHPAAGETAIGFNYSCDPNVGVRGQVTFVTIRDVRAGEELTVDVAMIEGRAEFRLICRCGATGCRAVQSGTDWCLPDLQRRYEGYFASFLGRRIEKLLMMP